MTYPLTSSIEPSQKTASFAAPIAVDDAILAATATEDEADTTLDAADLVFAGPWFPARIITVTLSNTVGAFNSDDPIVITGVGLDGEELIEELLPSSADGNEVLSTTKPFVSLAETGAVFIPTQADDDGTISIGTSDLWLTDPPRWVRCMGTGTLGVVYANGLTDTIADIAVGELLPIAPVRIIAEDTSLSKFTLLF